MSQTSTLECGNIRLQIEIAKRVDHLKQLLAQEETPASQSIQRAIHNRGTQTEIDALAGLLGGADHALSVAAAQWIDHQAQSFHRVGHPGESTWWLSPLTVARLVASLSSRHPQVRWHLLSAYPVLQFGEPSQVLPVLLDRLADREPHKFPLAALRAIQTLGIDLVSGAIGRLSPLANDSDPKVRSEMYRLLDWLGSEAVEAVPLLVNRIVMEAGQASLRREATLALIALEPSHETILEAINPENREAIIQALREVGETGRKIRQSLNSTLVASMPAPHTELASPQIEDTPTPQMNLASQRIESVPTPERDVISRTAIEPMWFNKVQIADLLGVSPKTVTRMLRDQRLVPLETRPRGSGRANGHFDYSFDPTTLQTYRRYVIDQH